MEYASLGLLAIAWSRRKPLALLTVLKFGICSLASVERADLET
jgi:hypothetical protein